jgi:AAA+ ATPase superfamily predicted ATPase
MSARPDDTSFIGREPELAALRAAYSAPRSAFWPIYGRRRVGKSELILHFSRGHSTLYFVGKRAPAEQMMREFLESAAALLEEPLLGSMPVETWKKTIEAVTSRWQKKEKLLLVFDEFQWIAEKSPEITSVLQELWDRSWQKSGRMFLILCGSYIGFMEREVLGKKSPLYGRRTGQILLKPFGYREAARFHPGASVTQKAMTYFICGGIPLYLRFFEAKRSVLQNIEHALLSEQAPLYREPDFLLREELREVEKYYTILMALAGGSIPSREISRRSGIGARSLHYYLDQLTSLGYIGKHFPLTQQRPKVRDVRYRLLDPLLRFWFHFIYPHTSLIAQLGAQRAAAEVIRPGLESYFGACYETLCREALPVIYERERVSAAFEVGSYWDAHVQIDIVGLRQDGWTDLSECKWGPVASLPAVAAELERKIAHYPNTRGATIGRRLFLRSLKRGRKARVDDLRIHTLEELYGQD